MLPMSERIVSSQLLSRMLAVQQKMQQKYGLHERRVDFARILGDDEKEIRFRIVLPDAEKELILGNSMRALHQAKRLALCRLISTEVFSGESAERQHSS